MKKVFLLFFGLLVLLSATIVFANDDPKPFSKDDSIAVLKLEKDQVIQQNKMLQLQQAFKDAQAALNADTAAIQNVTDKAMSDAQLDKDKWEPDTDRLVFTPKKK